MICIVSRTGGSAGSTEIGESATLSEASRASHDSRLNASYSAGDRSHAVGNARETFQAFGTGTRTASDGEWRWTFSRRSGAAAAAFALTGFSAGRLSYSTAHIGRTT